MTDLQECIGGMEMEKFYLGFDAGTQSVKVTVYNEKMECVASTSAPTTLTYPHPGWVDMDVDEYLALTVNGIAECGRQMREKGLDPKQIQSIMGDGIICGIAGVDEEGNAIGLVVKPQMISKVSHGRPAPKAASKDEMLLESDLIVVAIGQGIETKSFEEHGIKVQRGVISALNTGNITPQDGEMSEGVFAGGDCVTGPATVIKAIAAGKVAAANIDEYLGFNHEITCDVEIPYASNEDKVACGRVEVALREAAERKNDFEPIEYGFSCEEACQEAGRCLRCDHFGFGAFRGGREEQW